VLSFRAALFFNGKILPKNKVQKWFSRVSIARSEVKGGEKKF